MTSTTLPIRGLHRDEASPGVSQGPSAVQFGKGMKKKFPFDAKWTNLNHGSFGIAPNAVTARQTEYQTASLSRPDLFIRYDYQVALRAARASVAKLLNAPLDTVVFVPNATDGVNTVLRNWQWNPDGKDVMVSFNTAYGACAKAIDYLVDYFAESDSDRGRGRVESYEVVLDYPVEDDEVLNKFRETVEEIKKKGKRARMCMFDVVSSNPGVKFPWIEMTKLCKELGVVSLVDGAQGVGMVPLDLTATDPDFFVSNCHKWLYAPIGSAVFYVPERNQNLITTTLGTSHGYIAKSSNRINPLPPSEDSNSMVANFSFVGTRDNSPFLCVKDAIEWRESIGGEQKIMEYTRDLSRKGAELVAKELGTFVMDNSTKTLTDCGMANVALPCWVGKKGERAGENDVVLSKEEAGDARQWMFRVMMAEHDTYITLFVYKDRLWTRLSAQIYLELADYEFAAHVLKTLVKRAGKGEYRSATA